MSMDTAIDYIKRNPDGSTTIGGPIYYPDIKSELIITPMVKMQFTHPMPNWWFRLWYRLLLGWVWKKVG